MMDQIVSRRRKPSQILHSPRKAKSYWFYTPAEVIALYQICANTLANWVKAGLQRVEGKELIYRGDVLNAFHQARKDKSRRPCGPAEAFCLHCKQPRTLSGTSSHRVVWHNSGAGKLHWSCSTCGGDTETFLDRAKFLKLKAAGAKLSGVNDD
jgi:hypothetical protein